MKYRLQEGKWGEDWKDINPDDDYDPDDEVQFDHTDLDAFIKFSEDMDLWENWERRIIDDAGNEVYHIVKGDDEGPIIDLCGDPVIQMNSIFGAYYIEDTVLLTWVKAWLADQEREDDV